MGAGTGPALAPKECRTHKPIVGTNESSLPGFKPLATACYPSEQVHGQNQGSRQMGLNPGSTCTL